MASKQDDMKVTEGSGNVFADLGVAEPEEELAKAQLASHIREAIRRRKLTQAAAADPGRAGSAQDFRADQRPAHRLLK